MFEIEYDLTLEDEINSVAATKTYVSQLPLFYWQTDYIAPLVFLVINIPYLWQCFATNVLLYTNFERVSIFGTVLNLVLAFLTMPQIQAQFPTYFWLQKYKIKQYWLSNPESIKPRKIRVTDTKFIYKKSKRYLFLEEDQEISYSWDTLRRYFQNEQGFILEFQKHEQRYFIPRRIFADIDKLDKFREILSSKRI